jgi:2-oxo-4-hydroxy-4-carboxy-5-ureidoimidazoline decarboxylase
MTLEEFNKLDKEKAGEVLFKCCGCTEWMNKLMEHFPFPSMEDLILSSDKAWFSSSKEDWLEAFSHHPKIGEKAGENKKHASTKEWASQEQSEVNKAAQSTIDELAKLNREYENKFGFIYIVYATGKSATEMLELLKERLNNDPEKELHIASGEQNKITHLRLEKLFA